jgi:nucleoside 2-deoxyribosyltransferase
MTSNIQFFPEDFDGMDDGFSIGEIARQMKSQFSESEPEEGLVSKAPSHVTVYLAGPMECFLNDELPYSIKWRNEITGLFRQSEQTFEVLDPNRGKTDGVRYVKNSKNAFEYNKHCVFVRDLEDVNRSNIVIANLSSGKVSFGTTFELGYAHAHSIPIIVILDGESDNTSFLNHPFSECAIAICYSLDEAVGITEFMFDEKRRHSNW